ncbi:long-chain-fatty-acid--CoA ligase [Jatrophihabitans endophyticus]|uniref:long-chain-fatty-acid--CoA ligase n=1 Tax=Jatrophihabitans endophyticus TaxID=1206085 RepID=UPI0019F92C2D|nr:long-chain-fatty-acid--CoA ligase [Jatrophihabitans endophyticus]MBE7187080.1 long-chain-fatty-acid--CoA ligase [Jatrophihabitans endophyticus]
MTTTSTRPAGSDADVHRARTRNHWVNHIARHAHQTPDRIALRFRGESTTWAELHARVTRTAAGLRDRGVAAGDRVAIMMTNRPEFLDAMFAASAFGAIAVPINFRLTPDEIAFILGDSGARILLVDEVTEASAAAALATSAADLAFVSTGTATDAEPWSALVDGVDGAAASDAPDPVDVPEDSPALIMYTSGTTGRPKGAVLSHQNLQCQALTLIRSWRLFADDEVNLCASPLFHIASLGSIAPFVLVGGTTVLVPSRQFESGALLDLLENERVTGVFLVPAQWQVLCADPTLADRDLSALKTTCWGAAPATTTLLTRMAECFPHVTNIAVFGQTEMSPVTCALDGADALRRIGSVGRPISTVWTRIVDADMNDVAPGEVGEIVYRGPGTMSGYWNAPDETAAALDGGWFHSGDLVRADEDGFIWVVDRLKDMIITGGENVYCAEVENALAAHPDVVEVSVVGAPDERWGETPVAVAVLAPGAELTVDGLRDWASDRLARYKLPSVLHVVDALPRNASGKVVKGELRAAYGVHN